jgi:hypothetical protein
MYPQTYYTLTFVPEKNQVLGLGTSTFFRVQVMLSILEISDNLYLKIFK